MIQEFFGAIASITGDIFGKEKIYKYLVVFSLPE